MRYLETAPDHPRLEGDLPLLTYTRNVVTEDML